MRQICRQAMTASDQRLGVESCRFPPPPATVTGELTSLPGALVATGAAPPLAWHADHHRGLVLLRRDTGPDSLNRIAFARDTSAFDVRATWTARAGTFRRACSRMKEKTCSHSSRSRSPNSTALSMAPHRRVRKVPRCTELSRSAPTATDTCDSARHRGDAHRTAPDHAKSTEHRGGRPGQSNLPSEDLPRRIVLRRAPAPFRRQSPQRRPTHRTPAPRCGYPGARSA